MKKLSNSLGKSRRHCCHEPAPRHSEGRSSRRSVRFLYLYFFILFLFDVLLKTPNKIHNAIILLAGPFCGKSPGPLLRSQVEATISYRRLRLRPCRFLRCRAPVGYSRSFFTNCRTYARHPEPSLRGCLCCLPRSWHAGEGRAA